MPWVNMWTKCGSNSPLAEIGYYFISYTHKLSDSLRHTQRKPSVRVLHFFNRTCVPISSTNFNYNFVYLCFCHKNILPHFLFFSDFPQKQTKRKYKKRRRKVGDSKYFFAAIDPFPLQLIAFWHVPLVKTATYTFPYFFSATKSCACFKVNQTEKVGQMKRESRTDTTTLQSWASLLSSREKGR